MRKVLVLVALFAAACSFPSVDYVDPDASMGGAATAATTATAVTTASSTGGSTTGCGAISDCISQAQGCAANALQTAEPACEAACMGSMQGKCKNMCPMTVLKPCEMTCEGCAHAEQCMGMDATTACDGAVGL